MSIFSYVQVTELDVTGIERPEGSPSWPFLKGVLHGLSHHTDRDGTGAFPSVKTLARYSGMDERSVRRCLRALEQMGLIRRGNQRLPAAVISDPRKRPICYDITLPNQTPVPGPSWSGDETGRGGEETPRDVEGGQPDRRGGATRPSRGGNQTPETSFETSFETGGARGRAREAAAPGASPDCDAPPTPPAEDERPAAPAPAGAADPVDPPQRFERTPQRPSPVPEKPSRPDTRPGAGSSASGLLGAGTRCPAHVDDPNPPPCGACKERRVAAETAQRSRPTPRVGLSMEELRAESARREREASRNPRAHIDRIREILAASRSHPQTA